ncbi:SDR family NAD(P)-dependent oxidoreductase [Streptomyces canus]|uniref:SDR family NAD(P)-dependent oxidoreductase n=1 Tax=Streptomyces canus TaxID=58343 RepID=UPI003716C976
MDKYSDKNVVITGGSSGMGLTLAELLVEGGARVVITGRSQAKLDAARERLGENAVTVRADVASLSDLDMLAGRIKSELGSIEALFVNAGISPLTPLESTTEDVYDELFAINVKGAFFTVQKLAPLLSANAGIVLTTSIANVIGMVQAEADAKGLITWDVSVDSTIARAHQHAAGARKKGRSKKSLPAASASSPTITAWDARAVG